MLTATVAAHRTEKDLIPKINKEPADSGEKWVRHLNERIRKVDLQLVYTHRKRCPWNAN